MPATGTTTRCSTSAPTWTDVANHPNRSNLGAGVTPAEFRRVIEDHDLTQQAAADLLLSSRRAVEDWVGARRTIPAMADELLRVKLALRERGILDEIEAEARAL